MQSPLSGYRLSDWLQRIETLHPRSIELGLERVHAVLAAMGLRNPPYRIVTVAGTNGKGSTVAMCDTMLRAGGYRVGSYTSPHLLRYNERIVVDGIPVSDDELCSAFARVEAARAEVQLTYFEFGTLAAFDIFHARHVEIALLEVGMGGRLDAVNAVDPDVAVITSIGIDHTAWLGPDRDSIGREKAGIFRAGRAAVCGDPVPPASVLDVAERLNVRLYRFGSDFTAEGLESGGWSYRFGQRRRTSLPYPALRGEHQLRNAATALTALELISDFPVSQQAVREGLFAASLPGRFQVLPGMPATILDVAHNAQAAEALAVNLQRHRSPIGRTLAVFGMLSDKAIADVARAVASEVDAWYVATLGGARGASAEQVAQALTQAGVKTPVAPFISVAAAYDAARAHAAPPDRIVVFGSFYTVGDILTHLKEGSA
jgi:dihydrofolate synthase / folylpolyglutamate synthase